MKKSLKKIVNSKSTEGASSSLDENRRASVRKAPNTSRIYDAQCIFCERSKYLKGTQTREGLIKYVDLRSDEAIRRAALEKNDTRMIGVVSRELVAAEAPYHRSCYKNYATAKNKEEV